MIVCPICLVLLAADLALVSMAALNPSTSLRVSTGSVLSALKSCPPKTCQSTESLLSVMRDWKLGKPLGGFR